MEQTKSMVEQIGRVVANELVKNQVVFLPSIGSLYVDMLPSQLNSTSGVLTPPRSVVKFDAGARGESMINVLMRVGSCGQAAAADIYSRWLDRVLTPTGAEIAGVGVIKNSSFTIDQQLDVMINPEEYKKMKLIKRTGRWIWIAVSIVCCVFVGLVANYATQWYLSSKDRKPQVQTAEMVAPQRAEVAEAEELPVGDQSTQPAEVDPSVSTEQQGEIFATLGPKAPTWKVDKNGRYRVVYGVFSTLDNATRAGQEAHKMGGEGTQITVRPFGAKYMVNLIESDDIEVCKAFIERNRAIFPDMWISKRRSFADEN
ncbi:MAG: hypothetical protein SNG02_00040 [Rikenellaceae bacterium]